MYGSSKKKDGKQVERDCLKYSCIIFTILTVYNVIGEFKKIVGKLKYLDFSLILSK